MRLPASPLKRTTVPSVTLGAGHAANRECWSVSDSQELHVGGRAGCVFGEGLPRIVTARKYSDRSCIGNRGLCEQHNGQGASIRTSERRHERLKHLCVIGQLCKHSIGNVGWVGARVLGHGRAGRERPVPARPAVPALRQIERAIAPYQSLPQAFPCSSCDQPPTARATASSRTTTSRFTQRVPTCSVRIERRFLLTRSVLLRICSDGLASITSGNCRSPSGHLR